MSSCVGILRNFISKNHHIFLQKYNQLVTFKNHDDSNLTGDGKDSCDTSSSNAKAKSDKEVNTGNCNVDSPANFAKSLALGEGLPNSVIMLGPIIGKQAELKKKKIEAITKLHSFQFTEKGANVHKVCSIGEQAIIRPP